MSALLFITTCKTSVSHFLSVLEDRSLLRFQRQDQDDYVLRIVFSDRAKVYHFCVPQLFHCRMIHDRNRNLKITNHNNFSQNMVFGYELRLLQIIVDVCIETPKESESG